MDDSVDYRSYWRQQWLNCLQAFADGKSQRQNWLDLNNRNPHWSYVEFMCCYFNDTLHSDDYDWAIGEGYVTAQEADAVAPLHRLLEHYKAPGGNDYDNEAILNDPDWIEIVAKAREVLEPLRAVLEDPAEKRLLALQD